MILVVIRFPLCEGIGVVFCDGQSCSSVKWPLALWTPTLGSEFYLDAAAAVSIAWCRHWLGIEDFFCWRQARTNCDGGVE